MNPFTQNLPKDVRSSNSPIDIRDDNFFRMIPQKYFHGHRLLCALSNIELEFADIFTVLQLHLLENVCVGSLFILHNRLLRLFNFLQLFFFLKVNLIFVLSYIKLGNVRSSGNEGKQPTLGELVLYYIFNLIFSEIPPIGKPTCQNCDAKLPRVNAVIDFNN